MSDLLSNPVINRMAIKDHTCTYCGELIPAGSRYMYHKGRFEGDWFVSKMHHECRDDLSSDYDGDVYTPYENERPLNLNPQRIYACVLALDGEKITLVDMNQHDLRSRITRLQEQYISDIDVGDICEYVLVGSTPVDPK